MKLERSRTSIVGASVRIVPVVWVLAIRILSELILLLVWLAIRILAERILLLVWLTVRTVVLLRRCIRICVEVTLLRVKCTRAIIILRSSSVWTLLWRRSAVWTCLLRSSIWILNLPKVRCCDSSSIRRSDRFRVVGVVGLLTSLPRRSKGVSHITHHV